MGSSDHWPKLGIALLGVVGLLLVMGCGGSPSSKGGSAPAAPPDVVVPSWPLVVDIDNAALAIGDTVSFINQAVIVPRQLTSASGHPVEVTNGPAGCVWEAATSTLTCEIQMRNLDPDECMYDVRTRLHDSTNHSAIMTGVDYVWPGPELVPNTAQPINETGYCFTESSPSSAGSVEGCSDTWQANIPPGAIATQKFGFTNVSVGQYTVYLQILARYQACPNPAGMARAPAGCFRMGDAESEGEADELPVHEVCLTADFFLDRHEATNAEYRACVDAGACTVPIYAGSYSRPSYYGNPVYDLFPVIYVSWDQASAYCTWQGKRLPTEAEWEYAARGGLADKRYLWGDAVTGTNANYWGSGDPWDNDTSEVEYYAPNGFGLYDMSGNVWEWLSDWYDPAYYAISPGDDPPGSATGTTHVVRGESWSADTFYLHVSKRLNFEATTRGSLLGFRCAAD
jgi:formylglycine-generating enzyme required for sulfatase activity